MAFDFSDIEVVINRDAPYSSPGGFGNILLVDITGAKALKTYYDMEEVKKDFEGKTEVLRMANICFNQADKQGNKIKINALKILGILPTETVGEEYKGIADALANDRDYVWIISTDVDDDNLKKYLSDFAEANQKLYSVAIKDGSTFDYTDKYYTIPNRVEEDTNGAYKRVDCIAASCAARSTGSYNPKFMNILGVDPLTGKQATMEAYSKKINIYVQSGNFKSYRDGFVGKQGMYIDDVVNPLYLATMMKDNLNTLLHFEEKISFDYAGFALIEARLVVALDFCTRAGIVKKAADGTGIYKVHMPDPANINPVDLSERVLRDVVVEYTPSIPINGISPVALRIRLEDL
ncbi:MAG: hypothetical protein ACRDDX_10535 [Cellulosilyticaceae bacterium]